MQLLSPDTDVTTWPDDDDAFIVKISEIEGLRGTEINKVLKEKGLSETTGRSKIEKVKQLVKWYKEQDEA